MLNLVPQKGLKSLFLKLTAKFYFGKLYFNSKQNHINVYFFSFSLKKFCESATKKVRENAQKVLECDSAEERSFQLPTFAAAAKQFLLICANCFALFHSRVNIKIQDQCRSSISRK